MGWFKGPQGYKGMSPETQQWLEKQPVSAMQARIIIDELTNIKYALFIIIVILIILGARFGMSWSG
jgi:hypothetical protein